jgi:hypothetical protein
MPLFFERLDAVLDAARVRQLAGLPATESLVTEAGS